MPWYKITLTEKQLAVCENEKLVAAFEKIYKHLKSQIANVALFRVEGDNCIFYLNNIASIHCKEIMSIYSAKIANPRGQLRRIAGDVGPQIFES